MQDEISLRLLSIDDLEAIDRIATSAFGPSDTRASEVRRYLTLRPNHWILASLRGEAAGVFAATDYGPFAYLGMMAVKRELQRRGIGQALLRYMLAWAEERGMTLLRLDATEAGYPLYARHGFEVADRAVQYQRTRSSPLQKFPGHVRVLGVSDVRLLSDFDTPIFGADRTLLFRALLEDFPDRAFARYDPAGRMAGFLIAQSRRLGPWVASSPRDAEALLQAALTLAFDGLPIAIAPGVNGAAVPLLERYGFRPERGGRHMQRGGLAMPGQRPAIYGITSFAIG